jgi:RNA polymerase sigma-70 factor, ECF subfamily
MERVERLWIGHAGAPTLLVRPALRGDQAEPMTAGDDRGVQPRLADLDEGALVAACLAGTRDAFDVIVERHRRSVYQLCYRFVSNHEDAADLAQEVFLRAYRGLKNFKGQATLGTWLYRIGVNACLNRLSSRPPATESLETSEPVVDHHPDAASQLLQDERARRVRAAIARLPKKQRATLVLRVYHDMSHQEIATIVGSSVGAVKANFFHALRNLKRILAQDPV